MDLRVERKKLRVIVQVSTSIELNFGLFRAHNIGLKLTSEASEWTIFNAKC